MSLSEIWKSLPLFWQYLPLIGLAAFIAFALFLIIGPIVAVYRSRPKDEPAPEAAEPEAVLRDPNLAEAFFNLRRLIARGLRWLAGKVEPAFVCPDPTNWRISHTGHNHPRPVPPPEAMPELLPGINKLRREHWGAPPLTLDEALGKPAPAPVVSRELRYADLPEVAELIRSATREAALGIIAEAFPEVMIPIPEAELSDMAGNEVPLLPSGQWLRYYGEHPPRYYRWPLYWHPVSYAEATDLRANTYGGLPTPPQFQAHPLEGAE